MTRPRLLDLFCGAGGCSVGYARAGFAVSGVDIQAHADYPFDLTVADALDVVTDTAYLDGFDVVHASPPCPFYSVLTRRWPGRVETHPDHLPPVRAALEAWGGVWVIENVPGAPLPDAVTLCGRAFGLGVRRHRLFASSEFILGNGCACGTAQPLGVYGHPHGSAGRLTREVRDGRRYGKPWATREEGAAAMGIDWMSHSDDVADAIPPAFTEYVGDQLLMHLMARA